MAGIDFNQLEPVDHRRTLAYVNNFIKSTTSFLNHFSSVCEEVRVLRACVLGQRANALRQQVSSGCLCWCCALQKLSEVSFRLQRLQITVSILEDKVCVCLCVCVCVSVCVCVCVCAGTKGERSRGRGRERGKTLTCWAKKEKEEWQGARARACVWCPPRCILLLMKQFFMIHSQVRCNFFGSSPQSKGWKE